jgi:transposase
MSVPQFPLASDLAVCLCPIEPPLKKWTVVVLSNKIMSTKMTEQQRKRTNIDQVFKDDAVKHLIQSEKPTEQIARELGTSAGNLRRWKQLYLEKLDQTAGSEETGMSPSQMAQKIKELQKELKRTQQQREILKDAVVFFGQQEAEKSGL